MLWPAGFTRPVGWASMACLMKEGSAMEGFDRSGLAARGFAGFRPVSTLREHGLGSAPTEPGVYVVLVPEGRSVSFLDESPGGHFKGRDPTVDRDELQAEWLPGASLVYVGCSGDLKKRLGQFLRFGAGRPVGHWGGRLIWQIAESEDLLLAWKPTTDHRGAEIEILTEFEHQYGRLPFANLTR